MRLAVCYAGDMPSVYMEAFSSIVNIQNPPDCEVRWFLGGGWCQARRRMDACEKALDWGAEAIVQLDVDQVYDPDILCRLLSRFREGYQVIAAMVPGRGWVDVEKMKPFQRLAWKLIDGGKDFEPVDPSEGDVIECEFPTSACLIMDADIFRKLPKPWYSIDYDPDTWEVKAGEDSLFFLNIKKYLGIKSYVDTTINVKHLNVFAIDDTYSERFPDWPKRSEKREDRIKRSSSQREISSGLIRSRPFANRRA